LAVDVFFGLGDFQSIDEAVLHGIVQDFYLFAKFCYFFGQILSLACYSKGYMGKSVNLEETMRGHVTAITAINRVNDIAALCTLQTYIKTKIEEDEKDLSVYVNFIENSWRRSKMEEPKKTSEIQNKYSGKPSHHNSSTAYSNTNTSNTHVSNTNTSYSMNQIPSSSTRCPTVFINSLSSTKYAVPSLFPKNSYEVKYIDKDTPQKYLSFILIQEESRQTIAKLEERVKEIPVITDKIVVITLATANAFPDENGVKNCLKVHGAIHVEVFKAMVGFAPTEDGSYGYAIDQSDVEKWKNLLASIVKK